MIDWSEWQAVKKLENKNINPSFNAEDWQAATPKEDPKENLLESALMAPIRITADALKGGYDFATQKLPGYWNKAKTEVPGFINPLEIAKHPLRRSEQTLAGLLEAGQEANKSFREIPQYAANRLHLIPEEWANKIPVASDNPAWDITPAINNAFGDAKFPGEAMARGAGRNILNLGGLSALKQLMPHLTRRGGSMRLQRMRNLAEDRGLNPLDINPNTIEDLRQFLPNTAAYRNLLDEAHTGDFGNLFSLQSDVGRNASGLARSFFSAADRAHGRAGLDARNALLDEIHDAIQGQGHNDISGLLRSGQRDYRRYMAFKPYRNMLAAAAAAKAAHGLYKKNSLAELITNLATQAYK